MKKRSISFLLALLLVAALLCAMPLTAGAEGEEMTDSKTVIMEYTGEPIDVSALFDEQPAGAVYSLADDGTDSNAGSEGVLEGTMLTVTTPGSFRVVQKVGEDEGWISLGVYYVLTVTVKDQTLSVGAVPSSTMADIGEVVGLKAGHTLTAVTLVPELGDSVGAHDVLAVRAWTVMEGDVDVSSHYNVKSVVGKLHVFSSEWGTDGTNHFHVCGAFDCDVISDKAAHGFENACDAVCDVCQSAREVPDHVWTADSMVLREPTEEEEGERAFVCLECGKIRTEAIPKLERVPVFLIVCVCIACAVAGGCIAYFVVRYIKKRSAVSEDPAEEKAEEKTEE